MGLRSMLVGNLVKLFIDDILSELMNKAKESLDSLDLVEFFHTLYLKKIRPHLVAMVERTDTEFDDKCLQYSDYFIAKMAEFLDHNLDQVYTDSSLSVTVYGIYKEHFRPTLEKLVASTSTTLDDQVLKAADYVMDITFAHNRGNER